MTWASATGAKTASVLSAPGFWTGQAVALRACIRRSSIAIKSRRPCTNELLILCLTGTAASLSVAPTAALPVAAYFPSLFRQFVKTRS